jgi:adenosylcobyric acid synthase
MPARALMFQGTGSNVGKSLLVAGLCRLFTRAGFRVAPFKPQNMSNNAAVAREGGEIGRAQALQARAARRPPSVHMNPVLLKPESETGAQIIVQGRRWGRARAAEWQARKGELLPRVLESFAILREEADLVLIEGAGSAAEVNLRAGDIANMGFARAAGVPVVMVGDIERGGVIASLVGTQAVLAPEDAALIGGFIVNRMRGDPGLFAEGMRFIAARTGWAALGLVPHFPELARLPAEDTLDLGRRSLPGQASPPQQGMLPAQRALRIAVPRLPYIANFDDLDPLAAEPAVELSLVAPGRPLPEADLVILPGSKATRADLAALRAEGWDVDLAAHRRRGGRILGICGGFQMLGETIADPLGLEGAPGTSAGLGFLALTTTLGPEKRVGEVEGIDLESGAEVRGYEIHLGESRGAALARPLHRLADGRTEGARSEDGRVFGTYLHGLFTADAARRAWLARLGGTSALPSYEALIETTLEAWADLLARHLDIPRLLSLAR